MKNFENPTFEFIALSDADVITAISTCTVDMAPGVGGGDGDVDYGEPEY